MSVQQDMQNLLQKEMDRKEFIKHVGVGFAAIVGITTVLKTISTLSAPAKKQTLGYGSSAYGGVKTKTS